MKTALHVSLLLAVLMGFAWPGFGQGSMSRFTGATQRAVGRTTSVASSSTNGFTINAQRDFDRSVALAFSSATRYWFVDTAAPKDALVAASRYENTTLWAQAAPTNPTLVLAVNARSPATRDGLLLARRPENPNYNFEASSLYEESQVEAWIQRNIRFANIDPVR